MKAYIVSSRTISAQDTFGNAFPMEKINPPQKKMYAIEPEYKQFINPMKLRRMSRVVKMGIASAQLCLKDAGIEMPEAVITTSGWGCLTDTYKFLDEIGEKKEETLSPATFIQSTHNTVCGQIALLLGCQEYSSVYVNDSSSFEHGLIDAMLLLTEGKTSVLLGSVDELNEIDFELKDQAGWWKEILDTPHPVHSKSSGTIAGEGSTFFLLSNTSEKNAKSCIKGVKITFNENASGTLEELLSENALSINDIDLVISGINGDNRFDPEQLEFLRQNLESAQHCHYKHLTGEFDSASAFSLWLADQIIGFQKVPRYLNIYTGSGSKHSIKHILIHHFKYPSENAFILVSKAGI